MSCIPVNIGVADQDMHVALISDVSTTGAKLFARSPLPLGTEVLLDLYLSDGAPPRPAKGKIVRAARREEELSEVWQWALGVVFERPLVEYEAEIADLCERQRSVGVLPDDPAESS